jgi:membrane dipeptidase
LNGHYLAKRFERRHRPPWLWNPLRNVTDLPRLREGRVSCSTFTIYVPPPPLRLTAWGACERVLATFESLVERNAEEVVRVRSSRGIRAAHAQGKLGALLAVEGGHVIGKKIERLTRLRERGVRLLTLTHFIANRICDAHAGPRVHKGLSVFGREVVDACVIQGIVTDLAHTTREAFYQVLEHLDRPPMVTHTGVSMGRGSDRHLDDDRLRALADRGGAMGVLMCPWYQSPWGILGSLDKAADVYCHVAEKVGPEHLMIGTDMDGFTWLPRGMKDAADLPLLTAKLLERGFTPKELEGILGGNFLRILAAWE